MLKIILAFALIQGPAAPAKQPEEAKPAVSAQTKDAPRTPEAGTQRNQNIQINLIDNNALNERLGREGIQPVPTRDFSAARSDYASEFGGMGRNLDIAVPDSRNEYHGEVYEMLQNNLFNARTFFQVGPVQKWIRNQYGFNV